MRIILGILTEFLFAFFVLGLGYLFSLILG